MDEIHRTDFLLAAKAVDAAADVVLEDRRFHEAGGDISHRLERQVPG